MVGIVGGTGNTGVEVLRLHALHPDVYGLPETTALNTVPLQP